MITLLKLGGSLITDKRKLRTLRPNTLADIVSQVKLARQHNGALKLVIGHGSGSFGHFEAKKYNTKSGVHSAADWMGYARVAHVASELSQYVWSEFITQSLPVVRLQPSSSLVVSDQVIQSMSIDIIKALLVHDLIPLIHGDVAVDRTIGGTIISTENLFEYLVEHLQVGRIILLGEVDGVLDDNGDIIPHIDSKSFSHVKTMLHGSDGTDVTGGMYQKVSKMVALSEHYPHLSITIANGLKSNSLFDLLVHNANIGTTISKS